MNTIKIPGIIVALIFTLLACNSTSTKNNKAENTTIETQSGNLGKLPKGVKSYVSQLLVEEDTISAERKNHLQNIAQYIEEKAKSNSPVNLTFICTHNSRRSHLSQIWAQTAAVYYGIPNVHCFSGGTEAMAFNHRSVKALRTAGFNIEQLDESKNPRYKVYYDSVNNYLEGFSKKFSDKSNPQDNFAAVMTCSHADKACPLVSGSTARFAIPYIDPKVADNTPNETNKYNERCKQIATEMFYLFSKVNL